MRVVPGTGSVRVIWNGVLSENTPDIFSREYDFEGYRVWVGRDERASSYGLVASYDIEDYNRFDFDQATASFRLKASPFTLEELRCMYADSCNDTTWWPSDYPRYHPLVVPGANPGDEALICYFEPQDFNRSIMADNSGGGNTPIRKVYPDAPRPPVLDPDSIRARFPGGADSLYLTEEGFIKYYEYETTIDGLLPTVPYWINVTAFDYGSPQSGLNSLETSKTLLPIVTYPLPGQGEIAEDGLDVFVYPNPYRIDEDYRTRGYEGRGETNKDDDRVRRVHFTNLPPRCTIRIYSLDGDFIREIKHDLDASVALSNHETWDLISHNMQQIVSGLYYWTVEDDSGRTQIGKLAVIF
jgi:hypothetical protein